MARSKNADDDLEVIRNGSQLWKVRSYSKWYHRKFYIDRDEGHLRYEPSHKNHCFAGEPDFSEYKYPGRAARRAANNETP